MTLLTIDYVVIAVGIFLITLVGVQTSSDDAASAFSGEKSELFSDRKERGSEVWLTRITGLTAISFMVLVYIATFATERSIFN